MNTLPDMTPTDPFEIERIKRASLVRIVDDDEAMRRSYDFMLKSHGWRVVCYPDAESFLEDDLNEGGCLILDVRMPRMSGLELQQRMAAKNIDLPVVFATGHGDVDMAVSVMQKGACDFMLKPVDPVRLRAAVLRWCAYDADKKIKNLGRKAREEDLKSLTERELEVLNELVKGSPYKCIAQNLSISERTVKFHKASICQKLGVKTTAELAALISKLS